MNKYFYRLYQILFKHQITMHHPASLRNREVILPELQRIFKNQLSDSLNFLSVAEGTGSHIEFFHPHFPNWTFHPTEYQVEQVEMIEKNLTSKKPNDTLPKNVKKPKILDSSNLQNWDQICQEKSPFDIIFNVNMIHISPFSTAVGLFHGAGKYLNQETGKLIIYGPFAFDGVLQPESNVKFDQSLRSRNQEWGIRDVDKDLADLAEKNGLELVEKIAMPSNNFILVYAKKN